MQQNVLKNPSAEAAETSDSIGEVLARVRGARKLERGDAAKALGVNLAIIDALEENAFQRIGAPVFVRGYLARYARLLGLPEQEVLDWYKRVADNEPPPLRVSHTNQPPLRKGDASVRWFSYVLALAVLGWLGWLGLQQVGKHSEPAESAAALVEETETEDSTEIALLFRNPADAGEATDDSTESDLDEVTPEARSTPATVLPSAPADEGSDAPEAFSTSVPNRLPSETPAAPLTGQAEEVKSEDEPVAVTENSSPTQDVVTAVAETPPGQNTVTAEVETPPGQDTVTAATEIPSPAQDAMTAVTEISPLAQDTAGATDQQGDSQLVLRFTDDCWVDVKDADGNTLVFGVKRADAVSTVSGPAPFSLTLGNAPAVEIEFNGKVVDRSVYVPEQDTVSRFVLDVPNSDG